MKKDRFQSTAALLFVMLLLLSLGLLMGCGACKPSEVVALQPPRLACSPDPVPPEQADPVSAGVYILNLWAAGQSCREAVSDYQRWADSLPK